MNREERRIQELESELRRLESENKQFKDAAYALLEQLVPYRPLTEEDFNELINETTGKPIREIIADLEQTPV